MGKKKRKPYLLSSDDEDLTLDERWLLSYSDLMTLLFGFFIILYALSYEHPEKLDGYLKNISDGGNQVFGTKKSDDISPENSTAKNSIEESAKIDSLKQQIQKNSLQTISFEKLTQLEKKIEKIEQEKTQLEEQINNMKISETLSNEKKLKIQKELKEAEQLTSEQKSDLSKMEATYSSKNRENKKIIETQKSEISSLKSQLEMANNNKSEKGQFLTKSYLSAMIYWPTKDHDIDLSVETPDKHIFDFQHRKFSNEKGEFVLDTRRGPGVEVWHGEDVKPGIYKISLNLYSQYGNKKPAIVKGHLSTVHGIVSLPEVVLDQKHRRANFRFRLDEKSKLELLP